MITFASLMIDFNAIHNGVSFIGAFFIGHDDIGVIVGARHAVPLHMRPLTNKTALEAGIRNMLQTLRLSFSGGG